MTDKERYAMIGTWVEYFEKEEGIKITRKTVETKLAKAGVVGRTGRSNKGRLCQNGYYAESDVRRLCGDLLQDLPQADENGLIELNGEAYGTIPGLSRYTGISHKSIRSRITESTPSIQGKAKLNHIRTYYSVTTIRGLCQDLLENPPQANVDGCIELNGTAYRTIGNLSRLLGIAGPTIQTRIAKSTPSSVKGLTVNGVLRDFYSEAEIKELHRDLLDDLPEANREGLIEINDEIYGTIESLSRYVDLSADAIKSRVTPSTPSIQGKTKSGHVCTFYLASAVRKLCQELTENLPQANENGIIELDGKIYGTVRVLSQNMGILERTIRSRVTSDIPSIQGKAKNGNVYIYYLAAAICTLCQDLLKDFPQANEEGLIELDDEIYGTIESLSRYLGISADTIKARVAVSSTPSIQGKIRTGQIHTFYPASKLRELCADLIAKKSKK